MNKIIIDYGKSGKNYYYKDNQLYTEAGELVPKGEALELHFRETGRTPLVTGSYTQPLVTFKEDRQIDETKFSLFHLFLDQLSAEEQEHQITLAIKRIRKHIIFLPQTGLDGDTRDEVELIYERQIEALEQRLQGNTAKSWDSLRQSLIGEYIEELSPEDFDHVMNDYHLPHKGRPILWKGKKSEAIYFSGFYGFTLAELNKCFTSEDGKPFHKKNASEKMTQSSRFIEILNKHKRQ